MDKLKKTKKAYQDYLDTLAPPQGDKRWIIGGKIRMALMWQSKYGQAMREHNPIGFEVGYNDWKR